MVSKYFSVKTHLSFKVTLYNWRCEYIPRAACSDSLHREIPLGRCIFSADLLQTGETLQWSYHRQPIQRAAAERSFAEAQGTWSLSLPWLFCKTGWGHIPSARQKGGCVSVAHNSPEKLMSTKVCGVYFLHTESCGRRRRMCHLRTGKHCLCSDSGTEWNISPAREERREKTASDRVSEEDTTVADWPLIQAPLRMDGAPLHQPLVLESGRGAGSGNMTLSVGWRTSCFTSNFCSLHFRPSTSSWPPQWCCCDPCFIWGAPTSATPPSPSTTHGSCTPPSAPAAGRRGPGRWRWVSVRARSSSGWCQTKESSAGKEVPLGLPNGLFSAAGQPGTAWCNSLQTLSETWWNMLQPPVGWTFKWDFAVQMKLSRKCWVEFSLFRTYDLANGCDFSHCQGFTTSTQSTILLCISVFTCFKWLKLHYTYRKKTV